MAMLNPLAPNPTGDGKSPTSSPVGRSRPATLGAVLAYQRCDHFSEWLIYFAIIFSPWAFGTPEFWSGFDTSRFWPTWVMNVTGYLLGLLLLFKLQVRWRFKYQPPAWRFDPAGSWGNATRNAARFLTIGLAILTCAILAYCLIAGLNARSIYDPLRMEFIYQQHLKWLPHSYDRHRTLQGFANYLALACFFWAVRDWLTGKTSAEIRVERSNGSAEKERPVLPARLRRLLWVISINGALLGIEGICQRLSGTSKLLWVADSKMNRLAEFQFGPFAYRANAAQYFNLVWPVTFGFWWSLRRAVRERVRGLGLAKEFSQHLLLLCVFVMAACPIYSLSRGGALVAFGNLAIAMVVLLFGSRRQHPLAKFTMLLFFGAVLAFGLQLSWDQLSKRFKSSHEGYTGRESTYQTARKIAQDYPRFGTGPGTFEPVFQLYRESAEEYWPAQLHNDWLETRITFGWAGITLILLAFLSALARWFLPGNPYGGSRFVSLLWAALAGCLIHARFDFPLQMYSILFLFLILCSIAYSLSRHRP